MDLLKWDPYKVLEIEKDASASEIQAAFRKAALTSHPDKVSDPVLKAAKAEELQQVLRAYNIIGDKERREEYDDTIRLAEARAAKVEQEQFIAFALKLYEETKKAALESNADADYPNLELTHSSPGDTYEPENIRETIENKSSSIEQSKLRSSVQEPSVVNNAKQRDITAPTSRNAKADKSYAIPVEQLNLQLMNAKEEDPRIDIVAVHGLGAIPDLTWKEKSSGINWLSHEAMLPSAVPEARILRFGYDSLWMGKTPIRTSLSTIAYKLLLSLNMIRTDDLQRPIIFIGHCFGGLVIERALNLAKMQQSAYPGVFDSTVGIVFLGTPHRGTSSFTQESALLAAIAASSELSQKLETKVLETMTSENGALLDVADDFITLCLEGGPMITCFYEQRSSKLGLIVGRDDIEEFIVGIESATFDGHRKYGLELDHFRLNKFDSPSNPSYIQVRAEITRFYAAALTRPEGSKASSLLRGLEDRIAISTMSPTLTKTTHSGPRELRRQRARTDLHKSTLPTSGSNRQPSKVQLATALSRDSITRTHERYHSSQTQPFLAEKEADLRRDAIRELHEEEAMKQAVLREEQYQKRLVREKRAMEDSYLERLEHKMRSYGIENPQAILKAAPLPDDEDLSEQEIKDKDNWYKNLLRGKLLGEGLNEGAIDEILNDAGESMIIEGVETTVTKMASKWISTRTLDTYNVPWQRDKDDPSTIIIRRWVPDYERAFFWDHSKALREGRGRKTPRGHDRSAARSEHQEKSGEGMVVGNVGGFQRNPEEDE